MTQEKLRQLITHAVLLDRDIAERVSELKLLKERIAAEAETRSD